MASRTPNKAGAMMSPRNDAEIPGRPRQNGRISPKTSTTSAAPSLAPETGQIERRQLNSSSSSSSPPIGSWLCSEGPYREYIEALSASNPGLKSADPNNKIHLSLDDATVVLLDSPAKGQPKFVQKSFESVSRLVEHLDSPRDHGRRRIYIMEGLAKGYIAALGDHFFMEPTFFQRQERTCVWSTKFQPTSDALPQPSLLDPDRHVHLQYCELRQFNEVLSNAPSYCHKTNRHVGMTAPRKDQTIAIMRRKISWWFEKSGEDGWDLIILCDPQLSQFRGSSRDAGKDLKHSAYHGGYTDFIPTPRRKYPFKDGALIESGPAHASMLEDLIYYYTNRSDVLTEDDWKNSSGATIFAKKIVAAHYLQLVDYIKVMLPSLEVAEQEQWKALQTTSRRCGNYRDDIEDTLLSLDYTLSTTMSKRTDWKDCERDYQYIYFRLQTLKERTDNLMSSMTGLASIAGNQQNLEEAKRLKRLNLLALLFIPLAYTSSLFSMQDEFAPNRSQFWVYWVCAIGVVLFTSIVTWVLDSALNDQAEWKVALMFKSGYDAVANYIGDLSAKSFTKPSTARPGNNSRIEQVV